MQMSFLDTLVGVVHFLCIFNKNQYREPIFGFTSCETYEKKDALTRYSAL